MNRDADVLTTMRMCGMPAVDIEYIRAAIAAREPAEKAVAVPDGSALALAVRLVEAVTSSEFCGISTLDIFDENAGKPVNWFDARLELRRLLRAERAMLAAAKESGR